MFDKPRSHRNHRPAKWTSEYQVHKSVCPCKLHGRQWIIYTVYKQSEIHIIDYKYVHYITMSYIDIRIVYVYVYNHTITVFIPYCTKISCYTDAPWCPPKKKVKTLIFYTSQEISAILQIVRVPMVWKCSLSSLFHPLDSVLRGPMSRWKKSATRFKSLVENNGDCRANRLGKSLGKSGTPSFETKVYNLGFWWWCDHTLEAHTSSVFFLLFDLKHWGRSKNKCTCLCTHLHASWRLANHGSLIVKP